MFILKKGHQPGVYVPLRALFLVCVPPIFPIVKWPRTSMKPFSESQNKLKRSQSRGIFIISSTARSAKELL